LVEGDESFTIPLTSPAGAALGATTTVTVTIVDDDVATAPDAPTIGATIPGNAQATIAFTAPLSNGGSPTTSYRVDCTANGQPVGSVNGTASPLTVTGLTNGVLYTCAAFAINAIGTSAASTNVTVTPSATAPLALTRVVSRKTHTGIDAFDVVIDSSLPITGPISVEPRAIGAGHTVHFQFNNAINSAGTLSVVDAASLPIPASVATAGNDVVVTIPALADSKRATISLIGVNGALNASASLGFLVGDVNESRTVNSSDISATKARSGQTTTALNFRFDVNTSGSINSSDISALKARSGVVLP
ncbi:MAG: dockerin type I domain-containing protein, partial [Usitatibacteraceae bacterium]